MICAVMTVSRLGTFPSDVDSLCTSVRSCVRLLKGSCLPPLRGGLVADLAAPTFELPSVVERVLLHELFGRVQAFDTKPLCHGHLVLRRVSDELGHTGPRVGEVEARGHVERDETTHLILPNHASPICAYMHLIGSTF